MLTKSFRRAARAALLAPIFFLAACSDDPVRVDDHDHAEEVEQVRVYVTPPGQTEYSRVLGLSVTAHELEVASGANAIRVEWLDHDGDVVTGLDGEFRLEFANLPAGVTFMRSSAFSGTLQVEGPIGAGAARLELFHVEENHGDFTVTVSFQSLP